MTKLEVGDANDPLERHADAVADRVMRIPAPRLDTANSASLESEREGDGETEGEDELTEAPTPTSFAGAAGLPEGPPSVTRRKCAGCEDDDQLRRAIPNRATRAEAPSAVPDEVQHKRGGCDVEGQIQRACASCEEDDEVMREAAAGARGGVASDDFTARVRGRVGSGGMPLPSQARQYLEPRLGTDLGYLRVHIDAEAGLLSRWINARAFTLGEDVFFAPGEWQPHTNAGMRLLAHEVAHTLQSRGAMTLAGEGDATLFRAPPKAKAVKSSLRSKTALLGDGTSKNRGMTVADFEAYVKGQADWFSEKTLTKAERGMLWELLLLLEKGDHHGLALGSLLLKDVVVQLLSAMLDLQEYAKGFDPKGETIRLTQPVSDLARARQLGQAMRELASFVPAPVLQVVIPESGLVYLVDAGKLAEFRGYYENFTPTLEIAAEWPYIEELLEKGISIYLPLKAWVHDLHIFTLGTLDQLLINIADTSRARPVLLVLYSGLDHNGAFLQNYNFEDIVLDQRNLTLVVQAPDDLGHAVSEVNRVARDYGQQGFLFNWSANEFTYSEGYLSQVVIAGHGETRDVELATTGADAQVDGPDQVEYQKTSIDSGDASANGTEELIETILRRMDPADANIVFAGCLVGSHVVPKDADLSDVATAATTLYQAILDNPNLEDYVRERMGDLGIRGEVHAANATTTFNSLDLRNDDGRAWLFDMGDLYIGGDKLAYVRTGSEPVGALRAALETYAYPYVGPEVTTQAMRERLATLAGSTEWWKVITFLGYKLVLPPAPAIVDVAYVLDLSHRIDYWFNAGWANSISVEGLAGSVKRKEAKVVFAAMLAADYVGPHLAVGVNEAWLWHDPDKAGDFMRALTYGKHTRRTFEPLLSRTIVNPNLALLFPSSGHWFRGPLLLALTIAAQDGDGMPPEARDYLRRQVIGEPGAASFPEHLEVGKLLDNYSEKQILKDIGFGESGDTVANVDTNDNNRNDTYVPVDPHMAIVTEKSVRVRSKPSGTSAVIGHVEAGAEVRVMGETDGWSLVDHLGQAGFIQSSSLERKKDDEPA